VRSPTRLNRSLAWLLQLSSAILQRLFHFAAVVSVVLVDRRPGPAVLPPAIQRRLQLSLSAEQRTSLRGHRRSCCGLDLVLQLPRGGALQPGDWLLSDDGVVAVEIVAAPEQLLRVSADDPLALLQAAYHLGNRHVALELHDDHLLLPCDSVLRDLLHRRGLTLAEVEAPFQPEAGAYALAGHGEGHGHHHH